MQGRCRAQRFFHGAFVGMESAVEGAGQVGPLCEMIGQVADRAVGHAGGGSALGISGVHQRGQAAHALAGRYDRQTIRKIESGKQHIQQFICQCHGLSVHPSPGVLIGHQIEDPLFRVHFALRCILVKEELATETVKVNNDPFDGSYANLVVAVSKAAEVFNGDDFFHSVSLSKIPRRKLRGIYWLITEPWGGMRQPQTGQHGASSRRAE